MKKQLLIYLFALSSLSSFAQDKAMLTKQETVNYLDKVLQRSIGYKSIWSGSGCYCQSIVKTSFKIENEEVVYSRTYSDYYVAGPGDCSKGCDMGFTINYKFNPAYIKDIIPGDIYKGKEPVLCYKITFIKDELVKEEFRNTKQTNNRVYMYVFVAEKNDFEKIKKALFHLRDLCKAEDDPFGN